MKWKPQDYLNSSFVENNSASESMIHLYNTWKQLETERANQPTSEIPLCKPESHADNFGIVVHLGVTGNEDNNSCITIFKWLPYQKCLLNSAVLLFPDSQFIKSQLTLISFSCKVLGLAVCPALCKACLQVI